MEESAVTLLVAATGALTSSKAGSVGLEPCEQPTVPRASVERERVRR